MNCLIILANQLGKFRVQTKTGIRDNFSVGAKFKSIKQLKDIIELEKQHEIHLTEHILCQSNGIYLLSCGKCGRIIGFRVNVASKAINHLLHKDVMFST